MTQETMPATTQFFPRKPDTPYIPMSSIQFETLFYRWSQIQQQINEMRRCRNDRAALKKLDRFLRTWTE